MPTVSPATTLPSDFSTISAVASPTTPRIGRAKVEVGASMRSSCTRWTPGASTARAALSCGLPTRAVSASTNARGPAFSTALTKLSTSMSRAAARTRAEVTASDPLVFVLSMPMR
jgi:hypothetical protein